MSINFNGTSVTGVKYNGTTLTKVTYNGTVVYESAPVVSGPLCFTANTPGSTVSLDKTGSPAGMYALFYSSRDGESWTSYTIGTTGAITLNNIGDKVYFKGSAYSTGSSDYIKFTMTGSVAGSGNIMSICSGDSYESATTLPGKNCFYNLFGNCGALTSAPGLPATTLTNGCYTRLFINCTSLVTPPALPATTLTESCYQYMFYGCTSLTSAPSLPALTISTRGYEGMFNGCTSLTTAPALPATYVGNFGYMGMFLGCSSLTTAPALPATYVGQYGYSCMFLSCTSITTAPSLPAVFISMLQTDAYNSMFQGCTSLTTVPNLPSGSLYAGDYAYMFRNCTSLYVSDTSGEGYDKPWIIPTSGTATGNYTMTNMFENCLGTRSTDSPYFYNGSRTTYYTQNTPV